MLLPSNNRPFLLMKMLGNILSRYPTPHHSSCPIRDCLQVRVKQMRCDIRVMAVPLARIEMHGSLGLLILEKLIRDSDPLLTRISGQCRGRGACGGLAAGVSKSGCRSLHSFAP